MEKQTRQMTGTAPWHYGDGAGGPHPTKNDWKGGFSWQSVQTDFESISVIGKNKYINLTGVIAISLPRTYLINESAFTNCGELVEIHIPAAYQIGSRAFSGINNVASTNVYLLEKLNKNNTALKFVFGVSILHVTLHRLQKDLTWHYGGANPHPTKNDWAGFFVRPEDQAAFENITTTVLDRQFKDNLTLNGISLPQVTKIGANAFSGIGSGPDAGGEYYYEWLLENVNIPNVETIGNHAFWQSESIKNLNIPKCKTVGDRAFSGSKLESLIAPELTSIGEYAFSSAILTVLNLPKVITINNYALNSIQITSLYLPLCEVIGDGAIGGHLVSITLPKVRSIGRLALDGIVNTETTIVTMLARINTPELKTRIFGSKWDKVKFVWLGSQTITATATDSEKIAIDKAKWNHNALNIMAFPNTEKPSLAELTTRQQIGQYIVGMPSELGKATTWEYSLLTNPPSGSSPLLTITFKSGAETDTFLRSITNFGSATVPVVPTIPAQAVNTVYWNGHVQDTQFNWDGKTVIKFTWNGKECILKAVAPPTQPFDPNTATYRALDLSSKLTSLPNHWRHFAVHNNKAIFCNDERAHWMTADVDANGDFSNFQNLDLTTQLASHANLWNAIHIHNNKAFIISNNADSWVKADIDNNGNMSNFTTWNISGYVGDVQFGWQGMCVHNGKAYLINTDREHWYMADVDDNWNFSNYRQLHMHSDLSTSQYQWWDMIIENGKVFFINELSSKCMTADINDSGVMSNFRPIDMTSKLNNFSGVWTAIKKVNDKVYFVNTDRSKWVIAEMPTGGGSPGGGTTPPVQTETYTVTDKKGLGIPADGGPGFPIDESKQFTHFTTDLTLVKDIDDYGSNTSYTMKEINDWLNNPSSVSGSAVAPDFRVSNGQYQSEAKARLAIEFKDVNGKRVITRIFLQTEKILYQSFVNEHMKFTFTITNQV